MAGRRAKKPARQPTLPELIDQGSKALAAGRFDEAAEIGRRLLKKRPQDPQIIAALARAENGLGHADEAVRLIGKAIKIAPNQPKLYAQLARFHRGANRFDEALTAIEHAVRKGGRPEDIALKGQFLRLASRYEEAYELLRPYAERDPVPTPIAVIFAQVCTRFGERERGIDLLERVIADGATSRTQRVKARFRLARIFDGAKRYDAAFEQARLANEEAMRQFDPEAYDAEIDRLIDLWSPEFIRSLPRATTTTDLPIFIVGMMRSGTSLVEQILSSHPLTHGAGELIDLQQEISTLLASSGGDPKVALESGALSVNAVTRAGSQYLRGLRKRNRAAERITDKMWHNAMHLGLISIMLPGARIVHIRRSPLDTCLSCWMLDFTGGQDYAYDLAHMGAYYRGYVRIMDHWADVLDIPRLEVTYEELVADEERMIRRMIEFTGLPWDDRCLRFWETDRPTFTQSTDQVNRPMYSSSIGRYRNYDPHLGPLREALGEELCRWPAEA